MTNRTKDDLPAEGARENVNSPERDQRTGERARSKRPSPAAEERDRNSQVPRDHGDQNRRRTTL